MFGFKTSTNVKLTLPLVAVAGLDKVTAVPLTAVTVVPLAIPLPETVLPTLIAELAEAVTTAVLLRVVEEIAVVPPTKLLVNTVAVSP